MIWKDRELQEILLNYYESLIKQLTDWSDDMQKSMENDKLFLSEKLEQIQQNLTDHFSNQLADRSAYLDKTLENDRIFLSGELEKLNRKLTNLEQEMRRLIHGRFDRLERGMLHYIPNTTLSFEVALAEHCNLNCKGCDHFSPLAEKEFPDTDKLLNDFRRLSELFGDKVEQIHLLGGEPLLNPDLIWILKETRKIFPKTQLDITTNGLLLLKQSDVFWQTCHESGIIIRPTKYPITFDYEEAERIALKWDVAYYYFNNPKEEIKTLNKSIFDMEGKQNPKRSFLLCYRANHCIQLSKGKLYTCTIAPNIHHLNKYFHLNFSVSDNDGIDIYKAKNADEILKFLAEAIPFCKYCQADKMVKGIPWATSLKSKDEWL